MFKYVRSASKDLEQSYVMRKALVLRNSCTHIYFMLQIHNIVLPSCSYVNLVIDDQIKTKIDINNSGGGLGAKTKVLGRGGRRVNNIICVWPAVRWR